MRVRLPDWLLAGIAYGSMSLWLGLFLFVICVLPLFFLVWLLLR